MKCRHCGSEWTSGVHKQPEVCPFCGEALEPQPESASRVNGKCMPAETGKCESQAQKEARWAQRLGYRPEEKPWTVVSGIFISADSRARKLIEKLNRIHDEDLMIGVATLTNRVDVRQAAIRQITNQNALVEFLKDRSHAIRVLVVEKIENPTVLSQVARNDAHWRVRMAAINRISDETVLRTVVENEENETVRREAFFRVATQAELKTHFMNSEAQEDESRIGGITDPADLIDLAIAAADPGIRRAATEALTENTAEVRMIRAAAALSSSITASDVLIFEETLTELKKTNPDLVKKIEEQYPDPGVRYLARGRKEPKPLTNGSVEDRLGAATPTREELRQREEIRQCDSRVTWAREQVERFLELCNQRATEGERTATLTCYHLKDDIPFTNRETAEDCERLLGMCLRDKNFSRANVAVVDRYREESYFDEWRGRNVTRSIPAGHVIEVSTSW